MTVNIIDAPCGKGKTSWAIQHMNDTDRRFIFVTPFLDETKRIIKACPNRKFVSPSNGSRTKAKDLKRLLERGANIASTHELFRRIDHETMELIKLGGYTLILDEVLNVVTQAPINNDDIIMLRDQGLIQIQDNGTVVSDDHSYKGRLEDILIDARMNRLIYVNDKMLMWQFPADIFGAFDDVYVLTYMFDGQIQKYYYDYHDIDYRYHSVEITGDRYTLGTYTADSDKDFRSKLGGLIDIYEGRYNHIGNEHNALSVTWYKGQYDSVIRKIQKELYNYLRNHLKVKSGDIMWTCFKDQQRTLKGMGYANSHVVHNARAINDYRTRSSLAYMVNRYVHPSLTQYFSNRGIKIDQDRFALSELIQWVWRSRIRDGQAIKLYIPSVRMRQLLNAWMDTDIKEGTPVAGCGCNDLAA